MSISLAVLDALLNNDNATRQQAEAVLVSAQGADPRGLIVALFTIGIDGNNDERIRVLCFSILRNLAR